MWKDNFIVRLHRRSASSIAQLAPLLSSRPVSTAASLAPALEEREEGSSEQTRDVPGPSGHPTATNSQVTMPVTDITTELDGRVTPPPSDPTTLKYLTTPPGDRRDIESNLPSRMRSIKAFMMEEIDATQASAPLTAYCFMTGFIDAVSFSALYVWCAFQTGNSVQLALALVRLFNGQHDYSFHIADQQALCSVLSFILGALVGRIGDKIGPKTRAWMTAGTFIQTLFTMSAAIAIWKSHSGSLADARGEPAWSNALSFVALGFISASMGLQGIMGKRLNTQFTTTVVLTTTWCELMTEPQLFNFRRLVPSRDHKIIAILSLFVGGFVGGALLNKIGDAGTLGIGTGVRLVLTLWWLLVPAKPSKP